MEASDQELIARIREGDSHAFRFLVERYSRSVFRLAYRMTAHEQDAEDVVQETFLRAYRQLRQYEERCAFGTWLYRISANYALDLIRSRQRWRDRHVQTSNGTAETQETDPLQNVASAAPPQDRVVFGHELWACFQRELAALTPQERQAFILRHFEDCSIGEIARALEVSETAAKNSIFRAVQKIRRGLGPLMAVRGAET